MVDSQKIETAYARMKSGDAQGARELLEIAMSPTVGMSSAVAVSLLYSAQELDLELFEALSPYGMYALLQLCERDKNAVAKSFASSILGMDDHSWQLQCRALWYLVVLNNSATAYTDQIRRLRKKLDDGITFTDDALVPDPSFKDPDMAELLIIGLESIGK